MNGVRGAAKAAVLAGLVVSLTWTLAACSGTNVAPDYARGDFRACLLTDPDVTEPAAAWEDAARTGLGGAQKSLGIATSEVPVYSSVAAALAAAAASSCAAMVAIGSESLEPIAQQARLYRERRYIVLLPEVTSAALAKDPETAYPQNMQVINFDYTDAAIMAGYLAAGTSLTGRVAVLADAADPGAVALVRAFSRGVDYYNGHRVESDRRIGEVSLTNSVDVPGSVFVDSGDLSAVRDLALAQVRDGASVLFAPLPRRAQLAVLEVTADSAPSMSSVPERQSARGVAADAIVANTLIWCGTDFLAAPGEGPVLTSLYPEVSRAVQDAVADSSDGEFEGRLRVGSLADGGVSLAPFRAFKSSVPSSLDAGMATLLARLDSGEF